MTRKTHRQRRRAYERRRRTRRRQYKQQGGGNQQLTAWLLAANQLREASTISAPWDFQALIRPELKLTTAPGGPVLPRFEPSSLGDIITNIAATLNAPIPNGQTFNEIMSKMKSGDPEVYGLLQRLESVLRAEAIQVTTSTSVTAYETVDLTTSAVEKPHFLWIAYANLQAEAPEHPVLLKELPPAPIPTPATPIQQQAAAPIQQVAVPTQQAAAPTQQQAAAPTQLPVAPSQQAR